MTDDYFLQEHHWDYDQIYRAPKRWKRRMMAIAGTRQRFLAAKRNKEEEGQSRAATNQQMARQAGRSSFVSLDDISSQEELDAIWDS